MESQFGWLFPQAPTSIPGLNPRYQSLAMLPVASLVIRNTNKWNRNKIKEIFHPIDASSILRLAPPTESYKDKLNWSKSGYGNFYVKPVIKFLSASSSSIGCTQDTFWKKWWKLKIQPWLLLLRWKMENNGLPTRDNLQKRGITQDISCSFYNMDKESIRHLFFYCDVTKILLFSITGIKVDGFKLISHKGIIKLLFCLASQCLHHHVSLIQIVLFIWDSI